MSLQGRDCVLSSCRQHMWSYSRLYRDLIMLRGGASAGHRAYSLLGTAHA